jgi:hypothetical protein
MPTHQRNEPINIANDLDEGPDSKVEAARAVHRAGHPSTRAPMRFVVGSAVPRATFSNRSRSAAVSLPAGRLATASPDPVPPEEDPPAPTRLGKKGFKERNMAATASDQPTAEQLDRAREFTTKPTDAGAAILGDSVLRLQHRRPTIALADSYLRQRYRLRDASGHVLITPVDDVPRGNLHAIAPPVLDDACLLTAWSPNGEAGTWRKFSDAQDSLEAELARTWGPVGRVTAVSADGRWFEPHATAVGLTDEEAIELATRNGQPIVLRWRNNTVHLIPTGLNPELTATTVHVQAYRLPGRTCPLRNDNNPAERCVTWGGPFGSAAIHAASLWQHHRALGVRLLGCGPCDDGHQACWGVGGQALSLANVLVASRYGNATWRT